MSVDRAELDTLYDELWAIATDRERPVHEQHRARDLSLHVAIRTGVTPAPEGVLAVEEIQAELAHLTRAARRGQEIP